MPWTDNAAASGKPGQKPTREWGPWGAVEPIEAPPPPSGSLFAGLVRLWRRLVQRAED
ncbi:MAG TPA: hypothetical protein VKT30_15715 [Caulobacteraceae bacterium]|nr:hypothetical protein [Caulobacteraceae bacterium]